MEASGFKIEETSKFDRLFDDESSLQLVQAGVYVGVEDIWEYVTDAVDKNGVLFLNDRRRIELVPIPQSIDYNPTARQCTIASIVPTCVEVS